MNKKNYSTPSTMHTLPIGTLMDNIPGLDLGGLFQASTLSAPGRRAGGDAPATF